MDEELQKRFAEFAWHLGQVTGFASVALESYEVLAEFVGREVTAEELVELREAAKKVAQVFYNEPKPV